MCQQVHEHPTGSLWIARSVEDRGRTISESLYWNVIESGRYRFQAHWLFPGASVRRPAAKSLSGEIPLSRLPAGPVQVRLVVDGRVPHSSAPVETDLRHYSGQTVLSFHYGGPNGFPDIHGRKSLAFVAVEEGGSELGTLALVLPRWKLVDRQVDRARRDLAAASWRGEAPCQRFQDPPMHPPGH